MAANTEELNPQGGILNNPESLDSLEINFDDEPPMPMPIASNELVEEQNMPDGEDALLLKKFDAQGNAINQANDDVVVFNEFVTPQSEIGISDQAEDLPAFNNALNQGTTITRAEPFLKSAQNQTADIAAPITTPVMDVLDKEAVEPVKTDMKQDDANPVKAEGELPLKSMAEKEIKTAKDEGQLSEQDQEPVKNELVLAKEKEIAALKETVASLQKEVARLKSPPKKATVKKKTTPKKTVTRSKSQSSEWELRAAQPGKAWVSQKGRSELQPIIVGDTLSGIGRIESIEYVGNQWIVTGTQGFIKQ